MAEIPLLQIYIVLSTASIRALAVGVRQDFGFAG
jgi:hypothetical protein